MEDSRISKIRRWLKKAGHLPKFMRDFHDQKDLFKVISANMDNIDSINSDFHVPWANAQCYVIDKFLRFMAVHGYTLQRNRSNLEFANLDKTIQEEKEKKVQILQSALKSKEKQINP